MTLGEAIRAAMGSKWTQEAVAEALGVRQASVSDWVNDKSRPKPGRLAELEDLLGLPRGHFLIASGQVSPEGDPELAAMNVDLTELRSLDPEAYERIKAEVAFHINRARGRSR